MKRNIVYLVAILLAIQTAASAQSNPLLKYLPADASMVMSINVKQLGDKLPSGTFRQSSIYQQMMKDPSFSLDSILADPAKWGIDFSAGMMLTAKKQGVDRYNREQPGVHIFFKLSDAEKFSRTIKHLGSHEEEGKDGFRVYGTDRVLVSEGKFSVGWNNDVLVITNAYSDEMVKEMQEYHQFDDTTTTVSDTATVMTVIDTVMAFENTKDYEIMMERFKKMRRDHIFHLLTPGKLTPIASNKHLLTAMNSEADIKIWNDGKVNPLKEMPLPFARFLENFKGMGENNSVTLVNFENGKIVAKSQNFAGVTVADIYKKYPPAPGNLDLVRRLPAGTLLGLANISINQDMASEMMKKSGLAELLDSLKNEIPFNASLLRGVFKSHLTVAVIKSENPDDRFSKHKGMKLIVALPIADKIKFEELRYTVPRFMDSIKQAKGEDYKDPGIYAKHNDDLVVLSLDAETASGFLSNPGTGEVPAWIEAYSKYPMLVNINMQALMDNIMKKKMDDEEAEAKPKLQNPFDKMLIYGGQYENESIQSTMELGFIDPQTNSLQQLFTLLNGIAETKKRQEYEADEEIVELDSVVKESGLFTPTFKDPEVQKFANEYVSFIELNKVLFEKKDSTLLIEFGARSEVMMKRADKLIDKMAKDPAELQKFTTMLTAASDYLLNAIKEDEKIPPPPPPPSSTTAKTKVKTEKFTPPIMKN